VDAWVEGCDRLKIPIKAKEAARYVDEYLVRKYQTTSGTSTSEPGKKRAQFSQEAFVDAIVEWIVGDDQVSFSFTFLLRNLPHIFSRSMLSRTNNSATSS